MQPPDRRTDRPGNRVVSLPVSVFTNRKYEMMVQYEGGAEGARAATTPPPVNTRAWGRKEKTRGKRAREPRLGYSTSENIHSDFICHKYLLCQEAYYSERHKRQGVTSLKNGPI